MRSGSFGTSRDREARASDRREYRALQAARRRGELASWSLDLIQGLPGQTLAHWQEQLRQAIGLKPPHLSVYDLIVEPGTVFERLEARGQLQLPEADLAADLMELTVVIPAWNKNLVKEGGDGH